MKIFYDVINKGKGFMILTCVMMILMVVPASAKTSKWSFTMNRRTVDGSENGRFYKIGKGRNVYISGTINAIQKRKNPGPATGLTVYLMRSRIGVDEDCGSYYIGKGNVKFSKKKIGKTKKSDNEYYLLFDKGLDNYKLKAEGKLEY